MPSAHEPSIVTFLFTDLVGSTQLTEALGDEGAQDVLRTHNALVRAEVARHEGSEVKGMGDGFMIAFSGVSPAVACALAIQSAIAEHNREQPDREFMVRMGLNAGEAIQEENDFFGTAVIVAARISALATGGEVLASEAVRQLAQGMRGVEWADRGEFQLKGLREAFRVYSITSAAATRRPALRRPGFVGRVPEMQKLRELLDTAASGTGRLVLITGEPGIGKSRLAEEISREARSRGFRLWRGRCSDTEGAPPYLPFAEALAEYVRERPDDVLIDELGEDAGEIARLVPEVARRIPVPRPPDLPPEEGRYRLLEALRHLLESLVRRRPLMLVLEDLQWADNATCLLLRHLAVAVQRSPILVLGTCREEAAAASGRLAPVISEFARLQAYAELALRGLSAGEIAEMLSSLTASEPPGRLSQAVHDTSDGNPFFAGELTNHLVLERRVIGPDGEWHLDEPPEGWDIPRSIRLVVERRLEALTPETRQVLTIAAVAGREFDYRLMEALGEVPPDNLIDALDEAMRMGMLEQERREAMRLRFAHHLTRQTLCEALSGLRLQRLHLRIATALEQTGGGEPEDLAYHLSGAGEMAPREKRRRYLLAAGDKASHAAAWDEAAAHYRNALGLLDEGQEPPRADLLQRLGAAESGRGNWDGAVDCLTEAMALLEAQGQAEPAASVAYVLRRLYGARGQFDKAAAVVERGLSILGDAENECRCRLLAQAAFLKSAFGEPAEAEKLLRQAAEMAERLHNDAARGFVAFIHGMHHVNYCHLREGESYLSRAAVWALAGNDPWSASQASSFRRHVLFALGDIDGAEGSIQYEERLARKAGNFLAVCETKWISSSTACLRGELDRALSLGEQLLSMVEAAQAFSGLPGVLINLAYVRFLQGDWEGFEEVLQRGLACYEEMSAAPIDDPRPVALLLGALAGHRPARQPPEWDRYFDFTQESTTSLGEARITLAGALAATGEKDAAARLYPPMAEWVEQTGYVLTGASSIPQLVNRMLGMAASAAGKSAEAMKHYETALQQAEEMRATTELAETSYWYARHLRAMGDEERASRLMERARQLWTENGMRRQAARGSAEA